MIFIILAIILGLIIVSIVDKHLSHIQIKMPKQNIEIVMPTTSHIDEHPKKSQICLSGCKENFENIDVNPKILTKPESGITIMPNSAQVKNDKPKEFQGTVKTADDLTYNKQIVSYGIDLNPALLKEYHTWLKNNAKNIHSLSEVHRRNLRILQANGDISGCNITIPCPYESFNYFIEQNKSFKSDLLIDNTTGYIPENKRIVDLMYASPDTIGNLEVQLPTSLEPVQPLGHLKCDRANEVRI